MRYKDFGIRRMYYMAEMVVRYRNRNKSWTEEDVWLLVKMMKDKIPLSTISVVLGRTHGALRHAIKNTLYQQLLHHMPEEIIKFYDIDHDLLYKKIVSRRFYQSIDTPRDTDTDSDIETETDVQRDPSAGLQWFDNIITAGLTILIAGGMMYYVTLVTEHWNKLI